jgi:hypothetical protein
MTPTAGIVLGLEIKKRKYEIKFFHYGAKRICKVS